MTLKGNQDLSVVAAEEKHLDGMVRCHIKAFPGEFVTLVGARFIKTFYKFYISSPDGIVFVATSPSGKVVGLVTGGKPELRKQFSRIHLPFYILDIILAALTSSLARKRLMQHAFSAINRILVKVRILSQDSDKNEPAPGPTGTWSSLLSIGTEPSFRRRGTGKSLMEAFRAESMARGYKTMRLSVHLDNTAAIALYKKCGWQVSLETPRGIYFTRKVDDEACDY